MLCGCVINVYITHIIHSYITIVKVKINSVLKSKAQFAAMYVCHSIWHCLIGRQNNNFSF